MLWRATAERPAEVMRVEAVMVLVSPVGEVVVIDHPERPRDRGEMEVTEEWKAQRPPEEVNEPSRNCIRLCESTIPVLGLSSTPASARTSGSRRWASDLERKWVGTPMLDAKEWTFWSASICSSSWATIHFPVLRCGMECVLHRS